MKLGGGFCNISVTPLKTPNPGTFGSDGIRFDDISHGSLLKRVEHFQLSTMTIMVN